MTLLTACGPEAQATAVAEPAAQPASERSWPARLALRLSAGDERQPRTRLADMSFKGPLRVQRPFYPEGDVCHLYLLHPPGGLVSGDHLSIEVRAEAGSHGLITTPSAGKIYRSDSRNGSQRQQVELTVEAGASLEWLPMETLIYDGANGQLQTRIELAAGARFIGLDMLCIGRPHSQLPFVSGRAEQRLQIWRDGRPLLIERLLLDARQPQWQQPAGFHGSHVVATLVAAGVPEPQQTAEALREQIPELAELRLDEQFSISVRMDLLLVRYLGNNSEYGNRILRRVWACLRPLMWQRPASAPRIWNT